MPSATVLVVEDERALRESLAYTLERQGYRVLTAADGWQAVQIARQQAPDVIILDIMLPSMDGFEVCRALRPQVSSPILMLTARTEEVDRVLGLELGADDYLTKPFSMRELQARVKALLRRVKIDQVNAKPSSTEDRPSVWVFDDLEIDPLRHEVRLKDKALSLKPKEYEILCYLAEHRGHVVSRQKLLTDVWGWEYVGNSRTVDVHIHWLREKIEENPTAPRRIVTVRGAGYRFEG